MQKNKKHTNGNMKRDQREIKTQSLVTKAIISIVSATGGAILGAYTSFITDNITPLITTITEWTQDHMFPMPADQRIVAQAAFFISPKRGAHHTEEMMGVSLNGSDCLKPGGTSDYAIYEFGDETTYTDALLRASCRPSGRTRVTITPRSGSPVLLFDGFFNRRTQIEIGGAEGSYEYGLLTLSYVGTKEPAGPVEPANKTQPLAKNRQ
ncbi:MULTISPECIES: hypothetical protein [unclassified Pseudomonas]|uniref:hypothetical protein n=1 Tax=unclassified Pseudomonas TaxID=196821 RepID=UPI003905D1D4